MFAILFPEKQRADAAMAEVKRMANDPIPVAQRSACIAALQREIDELSHVEEAHIEAASCGSLLGRRRHCRRPYSASESRSVLARAHDA